RRERQREVAERPPVLLADAREELAGARQLAGVERGPGGPPAQVRRQGVDAAGLALVGLRRQPVDAGAVGAALDRDRGEDEAALAALGQGAEQEPARVPVGLGAVAELHVERGDAVLPLVARQRALLLRRIAAVDDARVGAGAGLVAEEEERARQVGAQRQIVRRPGQRLLGVAARVGQ